MDIEFLPVKVNLILLDAFRDECFPFCSAIVAFSLVELSTAVCNDNASPCDGLSEKIVEAGDIGINIEMKELGEIRVR